MTSENHRGPRLWLHQIGIFAIIPNKGKGDCLFRSISQALHNENASYLKTHTQIRQNTVHHMVTTKWDHFQTRITSHWKPKLTPRRNRDKKPEKRVHDRIRKEYERRMSQRTEFGTFYELLGAGDLFQFHVDYLTRVEGPTRVDDSDQEPHLYLFMGCRTNGCNVARDRPRFVFLHTRYSDGDGHWELLNPLYLLDPALKILPLNRKLCGKIYDTSCNAFAQRCLLEEYHEIEKEVRRLNDRLLVDDPEWPADSEDDYKGCGADDFKPNSIKTKRTSRWKKYIRCFTVCISFKSRKLSSKVKPE